MIHRFFSIVIIGLTFISSAQAQDNEIIEQVRDALKSGSSKELVKLFNETLDMNVQGKMKSYGKSQAEVVLRDFFKKNPPKGFNIIHKGASKSGLPYAIGEYKSNDDTYRVFVRVKKSGKDFFISEITFYKDKF